MRCERNADVKRALVDGRVTTTKTGKNRRVDLSAQLTHVLTALQVDRKRQTLRRRWGDVPAWVFVNEAGKAMDPDNFRKRVWPKLLAKAGATSVSTTSATHTLRSSSPMARASRT